jgi:hypothetical protein
MTDQNELDQLIAKFKVMGFKYRLTRTGKHCFSRWHDYKLCADLDEMKALYKLIGI